MYVMKCTFMYSKMIFFVLGDSVDAVTAVLDAYD